MRLRTVTTHEAASSPRMLRSKGKTDLDALVLESLPDPIGQPAAEAMNSPVNRADGKPMNARHDCVIRLAKKDLPPVKAFWSVTFYDVPNEGEQPC